MDPQNMNHDLKIACLKAIYKFYDDFIKGLPVACKPGCDVCCTVNVVATSVEIDYLVDNMEIAQKEKLEAALAEALSQPHFSPAYTTNDVAAACINMQTKIPEEHGEHGKGKCPLLHNNLCAVYNYRPFACRAMLSQSPCDSDTSAYMNSFMVTVNLAIYQILEALDVGRPYGNILDLMAGRLNTISDMDTETVCKSLPGFMPLPEEKGRFNSFINRLARQKVEGTNEPLGTILEFL